MDTEARVQSMVVTHLATSGWEILSVADTATRAHGTDIVAFKGHKKLSVEERCVGAHEDRPTQPSTQAHTWYANALLSVPRMANGEPGHTPVIALPEFVTYRSLYADTKRSLDQLGVQVLWVSDGGAFTCED